jgi:hypothetical protein
MATRRDLKVETPGPIVVTGRDALFFVAIGGAILWFFINALTRTAK